MQESGINWKAIRTLNGVFALHDGPNCYNSTLIAKGYTQIISQTGDEELKYYLWTFCDRENGPPKVGDIIVKTVGAESEIEHAATYIGSGKIFEKLSSAGIDGYFAHSPPGVFHGNLLLSSQYTIRKIKDSSYFKDELESIRIYRCQPALKVRKKTDRFRSSPDFRMLRLTKQMLSDLAFNKDPGNLEEYKTLSDKIHSIAGLLDHLSGYGEKDLFLYVNAASIWIHILNMQREFDSQNIPTSASYNQLTDSLKSLSERIRSAQDSDKINFILGASNELNPIQ